MTSCCGEVGQSQVQQEIVTLVGVFQLIGITLFAAIILAWKLHQFEGAFDDLKEACEVYQFPPGRGHAEQQAAFLQQMMKVLDVLSLEKLQSLGNKSSWDHHRVDWLPVLPSQSREQVSDLLHAEPPQMLLGHPRISTRGPTWTWWFRVYNALLIELDFTWTFVWPVICCLAVLWALSLVSSLLALIQGGDAQKILQKELAVLATSAIFFGAPLVICIFYSAKLNAAIRESLDCFNGVLMTEEDLPYYLRARTRNFQLKLLGIVPINFGAEVATVVSIVPAILPIVKSLQGLVSGGAH